MNLQAILGEADEEGELKSSASGEAKGPPSAAASTGSAGSPSLPFYPSTGSAGGSASYDKPTTNPEQYKTSFSFGPASTLGGAIKAVDKGLSKLEELRNPDEVEPEATQSLVKDMTDLKGRLTNVLQEGRNSRTWLSTIDPSLKICEELTRCLSLTEGKTGVLNKPRVPKNVYGWRHLE